MDADERLPPTERPQCGTDAGYQAHRAADEDACEPCLAARALAAFQHRTTKAIRRWARGQGIDVAERQPVPEAVIEAYKAEHREPEHGTRARYERERRAHSAGKGPEPCDRCRAANRTRGSTP